MAWIKILRGVGDTTTLTTFRRMFPDFDYVENERFTTLHNIVLGLDYRNLREHLQTCSRAEVNQTDNRGQTALYWAAARADLGTVQDLLAALADPNLLNYVGFGTLHQAAYNATIEIMNCLLGSGAQVDRRGNPYQLTPLIYTFYNKPDLICLKRLIEAGAQIDAQNYQGATALLFAAQRNYPAALRILLENNADINIPTYEGETPVHVGVQSNSRKSLAVLLSYGVNYANLTDSGRSILHEAAEYGDLETIKFLTSSRLQDLRSAKQDNSGSTPQVFADRRTNEPPEWHAAFSDLLASITEDIPENPRTVANEDRRAPASFAMRVTLTLAAQLYKELQQIHQYAAQLPRPPNAVLRGLLIVCLAAAWRLLP